MGKSDAIATRADALNRASYQLCCARGILELIATRLEEEHDDEHGAAAMSAAIAALMEAKELIDRPPVWDAPKQEAA